MINIPSLSELAQKALSDLIEEGKVKLTDDIYSLTSDGKKEVPTPSKRKELPVPPMEKDIGKLTIEQRKVIIEDGNLFNLAIFLGYNKTEAEELLYKKITIETKNIGDGASAEAGPHNDIYIDVDVFNAMVKHYNSNIKPFEYWENIYIIAHEIIHILNNSKSIDKEGYLFEEAITPIEEYEFYAVFNGAKNPFLIDISEHGITRMSQKRDPTNRVPYPPETFYVFDQLIGFDSLNHLIFIKAMREYIHSSTKSSEKIAALKKYYPVEIT